MNPSSEAQQLGQGLIETLMIVLFISVSILALIRFQHYLSYSTSYTQQQTVANLLAANKIEQLRDYQVINTTGGYAAYQDIASGSSSTTIGSATYSLAWTISSNTSPTYKTIDVTVTWTDRQGSTQAVRLVSRVASIDPAVSALIK
ncbi:hypothetical protein AQUSIP_08730 [Aquicella siphonis]|uniref:Uncharacterized protein n=1 Tax=Aquicella siphonis TaxID=254247 RepID=A0A5E4PGV0_9COXI|nr:hypothetical protein [Aquicella siphonis]VVC75583.1 hypothetical protein AQUSIP_08730 [Aquicella siphonis]